MPVIDLTHNVSIHTSGSLSYEEELIVQKITELFKNQKDGITLQLIADSTCKYLNCDLKDVIGKAITHELSLARHIICILHLDYKLGYSMQAVAEFLGRRSHAIVFNAQKASNRSSIQHHIVGVKKLIEQNKSIEHSPVNIIPTGC